MLLLSRRRYSTACLKIVYSTVLLVSASSLCRLSRLSRLRGCPSRHDETNIIQVNEKKMKLLSSSEQRRTQDRYLCWQYLTTGSYQPSKCRFRIGLCQRATWQLHGFLPANQRQPHNLNNHPSRRKRYPIRGINDNCHQCKSFARSTMHMDTMSLLWLSLSSAAARVSWNMRHLQSSRRASLPRHPRSRS